jgi:hypothetical protein
MLNLTVRMLCQSLLCPNVLKLNPNMPSCLLPRAHSHLSHKHLALTGPTCCRNQTWLIRNRTVHAEVRHCAAHIHISIVLISFRTPVGSG